MANNRNKDKVIFSYVTPTNLKDYHVSGVFGGLLPSGSIFCQFFSDRLAIPEKESYTLLPDGSLGNVLDRSKNGDIIRTVQANIVFNLSTAKQIIQFLQEQVDKIEKQL